MRKYMFERYYRRKAIAIKLLGGKCTKCGSKNGLQFDHVVPRKKSSGFVITKWLAGMSEEKFEKEIKKCQLLCEEHHNEKSILERGYKVARGQHGTISSYRYCKCERCRAAKRSYNEARKLKLACKL